MVPAARPEAARAANSADDLRKLDRRLAAHTHGRNACPPSCLAMVRAARPELAPAANCADDLRKLDRSLAAHTR